MWRISIRRKKAFLVTLVIFVTVVRVLVLSLQSDEEDTYEDIFKSRNGQQTSSSPHRHLVDSANETEGKGRKHPNGHVKENHHKRNAKKEDVEGNNFPPENQKWIKQKDDVKAKDKHHGRKNFEHGRAREPERDGEEFVHITTVSDGLFYTTDGVMVNGSNKNNSYSPTKQTVIEAGLLRVAYVGNRGSYRYQFQEPRESRRCPCELGTNSGDVIVTSEEGTSNLGDYDVLIFVQDTGQKPLTPHIWRNVVSSAKQGQRRVYASTDSMSKVRYLLPSVAKSNSPFHWSLTYHSKSNMTAAPYGRYQPFEYVKETETRDINWAKGKTGLVAWMPQADVYALPSSKKQSKMWKRNEFVKSLQAYIQVDLYGEQYKTCISDSDSCTEKLKTYKFYLAIEDSCCSEYITEKLWRGLSWGVVPIVVGAPKEDYLKLAPPNSFIYADDFATLEDLGDYLRKLDNTDEFYNDYFQWRQEGEVAVDSSVRGSSEAYTKGPPDTSLYSCKAVCRVATKYVNEKSTETDTYTGSYFDPTVSWWGESCEACGSHTWISKFN